MDEHVYKVIQLAGSSEKSIEDAVSVAVQRAAKTLKNLRWFEVLETRGHIEGGKVKHWQVLVKVGFTLDEGANAGGRAAADRSRGKIGCRTRRVRHPPPAATAPAART